MLDRSAKFRELGQLIRFLSVLMGATVAALGGFAGVQMRIIVAILGVTLAAVNAAPSIFSTELRVIINRRHIGATADSGMDLRVSGHGAGRRRHDQDRCSHQLGLRNLPQRGRRTTRRL